MRVSLDATRRGVVTGWRTTSIMRILHIFDHSLPLHSGYSFRSRALLMGQRRRGWETFHLTTPRHPSNGSVAAVEDVDGLTFHRTVVPGRSGGRVSWLGLPGELLATRRRLDQLVSETRPDILHAHSPVLTALPALSVGRKRGIPVVYEIRGTWEDAAVANGTDVEGSLRWRASRALETYAARRVDALGVICEGLRREFVARGVDERRIFVVPNAVDTTQFTPIVARDEAMAAELGLTGKEVVGFLGSFYPYEGLSTLLEAMARLAAQRPQLRALLVGGGPYEQALREQAATLGIRDRVVFVGRVPQSDVNRLYSVADLLVYPRLSTRVTELVTPLKPLEAMALARPVLVSDVGGHRELVEPGRQGELFRAGDVDDLAQALVRSFEQRAQWAERIAAGLEYVNSERTWARTVQQYEPVYSRLSTRSGVPERAQASH